MALSGSVNDLNISTPIEEPRLVSPILLAYIGDSVFDLIIRTKLVSEGNKAVNRVNKSVIKYVSAEAQAKIIDEIEGSLTEEEKKIYRRGKNSKPYTKAKNTTYKTYLKATGFEAVIGYLYLSGEYERISEIVKLAVSIIDEENKGMNK